MNGFLVRCKSNLVIGVLRFYRWVVSPLIHTLSGPGVGCRYLPTCSEYFAEAVIRFGFIRGGIIGTKRLCSCHPWSNRWVASGGWDPVEPVTPVKVEPSTQSQKAVI